MQIGSGNDRAAGQRAGDSVHQGHHGAVVLAVGVRIGGVGVDLLLSGGDVQRLGHGLIEQSFLGVVFQIALEVGQHGVGVLVSQQILDEAVEVIAVVARQRAVVVQALVDLIIRHLLRDGFEGGVFQQVVHDGGVEVGGVELVLIVGAQGLHGVDVVGGAEGAGHPAVGELGQDALADVVEGHGKDGFLAAELHSIAAGISGVAVAVGEGDVDVEGLAGLVADDLVFKAVDESAAAQRQIVVLGAAAGELHVVHRADVVDVHGVAVGGSAVGDVLGGGILAQQIADLLLHFLAGGLDVRALDGDGCKVFGQGHIVQSADALPVAFLVQTIAVVEVLVVVVGRAAECGRRYRAGCSTVGLAAAGSEAQRQSAGADKAECLGENTLQKNSLLLVDRYFAGGSKNNLYYIG